MKRNCLNPGMWEDGGRIFFFLLSNWRIQCIYGSGCQIKKELANVLKDVLQVKMLIKAQRTDLILSKVCRKDWHKRFIDPFRSMPLGLSCYFLLWQFLGSFLWFMGRIWLGGLLVGILEVLYCDSCKNIQAFASLPVIYRNVQFKSCPLMCLYNRMFDLCFGTKYRKEGSRSHFDHYTSEIKWTFIFYFSLLPFMLMFWSFKLKSLVMVMAFEFNLRKFGKHVWVQMQQNTTSQDYI